MSNRTASILSVTLSILLLVIFTVLAVIFEIIALNGSGESQGITAISISLACLGAAAILLGVLAWKATALMITKLNMNPVLAVTLTVAMATLASGLLSFFSIVVSIPLAGVK